MEPSEAERLLAQAITAYNNHDAESAAKLYMQAAEAYAAEGIFQTAGDLFQKASDMYIVLGKPEGVENALIASSNCYILSARYLTAFACQWLLAEYKTSQGKISEAGFPALAELIDPRKHDYPLADRMLSNLGKAVSVGVEAPYVTLESQRGFREYFKSLQPVDENVIADYLSILFGRSNLMNTNDNVGRLYFELSKALVDKRNAVTSKWREILSALAYSRACVEYAQKGDFKCARESDVSLLAVMENMVPAVSKDVFPELQYELYEEMEDALAKNFQEADRYYFKKMRSYTDILLSRRQVALYIVCRLWGICAGYGVGVARAASIILLVSVVGFPLVYLVLWYSLGIPFRGIGDTGLIRNASNAIYFSIVTFTTLGFGDISPVGWGKLVAALEVLGGYVSLALMVTIIARKMLRS